MKKFNGKSALKTYSQYMKMWCKHIPHEALWEEGIGQQLGASHYRIIMAVFLSSS